MWGTQSFSVTIIFLGQFYHRWRIIIDQILKIKVEMFGQTIALILHFNMTIPRIPKEKRTCNYVSNTICVECSRLLGVNPTVG